MKKLFISQPMIDRTDEEIFRERENAVSEARALLNEDVEVIDSFCKEERKTSKRICPRSLPSVSEFDPHKTVIGRRLDAGLWD